ncbi:MAG: SAM-dependent methyltransferase [Myxococcaceae bacterium]
MNDSDKKVLTAHVGLLGDTYRNGGVAGVARKLFAAAKMNLPSLYSGKRTHASVAAFYDLVTDEARRFYADSFHFGYFKEGVTTLAGGVDALTELVAEMAGVAAGSEVLDLGCGVCGPAIHIARRYPGCRITGVNISTEQLRQARELIEKEGLSSSVQVREANALSLPFPEASFDAVLSLEVAANVCVTEEHKRQHVAEMFRVLRPGALAGFADLVFKRPPTEDEDRTVQRIFFHTGSEYISDWPALLKDVGFVIERNVDILPQVLKTWDLAADVYAARADEVNRRYGKRLATQTVEHMRRLPVILQKYGEYPVLSVRKPAK